MFFRLLKARKAAVTGAWLLLLGCIAVSISASQDSLHLGRLDGYQPDSLKGLLHAVQTVFRGQGGEGEGEGEGGSARGSAGGLVRASQQSFTGITLLDWGQKEINFPIDREHLLHLWYGYRPRGDYSTRAFFEFMGFNYTAIGHNEEYSANVLDGGEYIAPQIGLNSYDVIVNIGYSAYVGRRSGDYGDNDDFLMRQYIYFRNLHEVGKKGSVYYHMVPFKGSEWFQYGVTRYTLEFFKVLVGKSGYEVIALEIVDIDVPMTSISKPISCRCLRVSYRKSLETAFMPFEEFKDIKGLYDPLFEGLQVQPTAADNRMINVWIRDKLLDLTYTPRIRPLSHLPIYFCKTHRYICTNYFPDWSEANDRECLVATQAVVDITLEERFKKTLKLSKMLRKDRDRFKEKTINTYVDVDVDVDVSADVHVHVAAQEQTCTVHFKDAQMALCYFIPYGGNFGDEIGPAVSLRLLEIHFGCSVVDLSVLNLALPADAATRKGKSCLFTLGIYGLGKKRKCSVPT